QGRRRGAGDSRAGRKRVFARTEGPDQVEELPGRQLVAQVVGHDRLGLRYTVFDVGSADLLDLSLVVHDGDEAVERFAGDHPDPFLTVAGRNVPCCVRRRDLLAGLQDRFDDFLARRRAADKRQVGTDAATAGVDAVALVTTRAVRAKEARFAAVGVAAGF